MNNKKVKGEDPSQTKFPLEFGASPDDFLKTYESLIYKVIFEQTRNNPRLEASDLFHEFFIHIAENDFKRLRHYRGECQPTTYLGKILRNFLYDQYRKKGAKASLCSLDVMVEEKGEWNSACTSSPEENLTSIFIKDALKETFSKLSNREKLMFDLVIDEGMAVKEIATLLDVKVKAVYRNNEKIKGLLKKALQKKGLEGY